MALPKPWKQSDRAQVKHSGQADVFPVERPDDDQLYALKRLKDPNRRARFEREITRMRELAAAGIAVPEIVELGEDSEGRAYFVMPWCDEGSLEDRLTKGGFREDLDEGLRVLTDLAGVLARIHGSDGAPAHRDLKPANVLMSDGHPMVTDFGLSLASDEDDPETRLTLTAQAIGSRLYYAPENENGFNDAQDQRPADFFAFGKMTYGLLAGSQPPVREDEMFIPGNRLAELLDPRLRPVDDLIYDLVLRDLRSRLTDWKVVQTTLAEVGAEIAGSQAPEAAASSTGAEEALAVARRIRASAIGVEEEQERSASLARTKNRERIQEVLIEGVRRTSEERAAISEECPWMRTGDTSAPALSDVGVPFLPKEVDPDHKDVRQVLSAGAEVSIYIDATRDPIVNQVLLSLYAIDMDGQVWILQIPTFIQSEEGGGPRLIIPDFLTDYFVTHGPRPLDSATLLREAEELGQSCGERGIALWTACAQLIEAGNPLTEPESWEDLD